jgi:hypothetical protein
MKIENFKVGMRVKMIVPEGDDCCLGRCGIPTGEIGIVQRVISFYNEVEILYPNFIPNGSQRDWSTNIWTGKVYEFAPVDEDWLDIWLS